MCQHMIGKPLQNGRAPFVWLSCVCACHAPPYRETVKCAKPFASLRRLIPLDYFLARSKGMATFSESERAGKDVRHLFKQGRTFPLPPNAYGAIEAITLFAGVPNHVR